MASALLGTDAQAYRPFDLTDADVARRHHFEIEFAPAEFVSEGAEHTMRAPKLVLNYGFGAGREVTLEGANRIAMRPAPGERRARLDDVGASFKQVLRRGSLQDASGVSLATEDAILLPGPDEIHAGASAILIASSESERGSAHLNAEVARLPEGRDLVAGGLILEHGDLEGLSPVMELVIEAPRGQPAEQSILAGLLYVPGEGTEWDIALRFGRIADQRLFEIRAGVTWQIAEREVIHHAEAILHKRRHRH